MNASLGHGWWIMPGLAVFLTLVGSCALGGTLPWLAPDGSTRQWHGDVLIVCTPAAPGWADICQDWTMDGLRRDKGADDVTAPVGPSILAWREHLAPLAYVMPSDARLVCGPYSPELVVDRHCRPPPMPAPIPLPGALALMLLALGGLWFIRKGQRA